MLLVDDRRENLVALEATLRPLDQRLVLASSGDEALRALLNDDFALILLDVRMPGMDGFETAAHIRRRSRSRHVPIIFLTAVDDDPGLVLRGYSQGAVDYLAKPFDPWVLRSKAAVFIEMDAKNHLLRLQANQLTQRNAELAEALELAEAGSRAKSSFLNLAGHELRTPLAVVNGYISLVIEGAFGPVPPPMLKPLRTVEEKAEELGNLVDAILTAARLEAGNIP
ncbi:MAG: response regulator, partial [Candidatus Dormibacteria bacterium]